MVARVRLDDGNPPICHQISVHMEKAGVGVTDMARRLGIGQSTMSRYVDSVEPGLDVIWAIEDHLELGHGDLLRAAGYVDAEPVADVERAIARDPKLDVRARRALAAAYRELTK